MDELFKCTDCGAIFEEDQIVPGDGVEKDSCPVCGSWGIEPYKEEDDRGMCIECRNYFDELGICIVHDEYRSGNDWCEEFAEDTVTIKADGLT